MLMAHVQAIFFVGFQQLQLQLMRFIVVVRQKVLIQAVNNLIIILHRIFFLIF